jgi:hypothetical protein
MAACFEGREGRSGLGFRLPGCVPVDLVFRVVMDLAGRLCGGLPRFGVMRYVGALCAASYWDIINIIN